MTKYTRKMFIKLAAEQKSRFTKDSAEDLKACIYSYLYYGYILGRALGGY